IEERLAAVEVGVASLVTEPVEEVAGSVQAETAIENQFPCQHPRGSCGYDGCDTAGRCLGAPPPKKSAQPTHEPHAESPTNNEDDNAVLDPEIRDLASTIRANGAASIARLVE